MKLISWNVNGLRACLKKGLEGFFNERAHDTDIFCFQETKINAPLGVFFDTKGFLSYDAFAQKKGYSGTSVLSKIKPASYAYGMQNPLYETQPGVDGEGRFVVLHFENFCLVNVYTPNSKRDLSRLDYRAAWQDNLVSFLRGIKKPLIICGDLNVAHTEQDIKNAKANRNNAGFTDREREKMTALLDAGFIDSFRFLHPDKIAYTWWSYMRGARENNIGWRLDYFLVSESLKDKIAGAYIYNDVFGSDHCPVGIEVDMGAC